MSRNTHFGLGLGILLFCVVWLLFGVFWFFAICTGKDSSEASIYDSSFIMLYIIFGGGLFGGLWVAFQSFRRALRPPERMIPAAAPSSSPQQTDLATPDEKLAHLVKNP